jgi:hypothetical protein
MRPRLLLAALLLSAGFAQQIPGTNYDEAKVPPYTLLDPLTTSTGKPVTSAAEWWKTRRPEILQLFEVNQFGRTPANARLPLRVHFVEQDRQALGGTAIRKQFDLSFTDRGPSGPHMRVLLYLPAHRKRSPVIVGLNFNGNQTVLDDPAIQPSDIWIKPKPALLLQHVAPGDSTRGTQIQQWQVRKLLARGYGLATIYNGDIEPDFKDAAQYSVRTTVFHPTSAGDEWGAIGAWAWGLSRALDYLQTDPDVDPRHIAVTGHSRFGKTADWAAAQDIRFAALLSTESGKGGQSLSRRDFGETVLHLEHSFPYWFCPNYAQWVDRDQQIPSDGNLLLSLIAPRPLYVASAVDDQYSDPKGEFLSVVSASRVYALLGAGRLPQTSMPSPDQPLRGGNVAYHVRTGKHDVTAFDWDQYLDFLDSQWNGIAKSQ